MHRVSFIQGPDKLTCCLRVQMGELAYVPPGIQGRSIPTTKPLSTITLMITTCIHPFMDTFAQSPLGGQGMVLHLSQSIATNKTP